MKLLKSIMFLLLLVVTAPVIALLAWVTSRVEDESSTERKPIKSYWKNRFSKIFAWYDNSEDKPPVSKPTVENTLNNS